MKPNELEERLIKFSIMIIGLSNDIDNTKAGAHLVGQIIRSGTSVALNYGEVQGAESKRDFVHKMKIAFKELRETFVCLRIIGGSNLCKSNSKLEKILKENNELISIFVKSLNTSQSNMSVMYQK